MNDDAGGARRADQEAATEVRRLNDEWVHAVVGRDRAALERIMADDFNFTFLLEGDDKSQFISDVISGDLRVERFVRENVNVRVHGATAVLTCRDEARWQYHGRDISGAYHTIHVYSERGGRWQLVAAQVCPSS